MKKYLLAIGLALLQTTFSMARDHSPVQNDEFEQEGYISQENSSQEFVNANDLVGARNSKQLQADAMQKDDMYQDNGYDNNSKRWGRKKADDEMMNSNGMTNGDNDACCPKPCKPKCCPKPKCCKPKCCPKPKCCKPKCCPKPCKPKCCPKPCKPKCPKPCCKPCEPMRQPSCTTDECCKPMKEPSCTTDGCCEPTRMMQSEKPKCCKPKTCCKRKPKCCDQDMGDGNYKDNKSNYKNNRNNMMNSRDKNAPKDM